MIRIYKYTDDRKIRDEHFFIICVNENMYKLSIIIPVYNTQDYVRDCLLSVIRQASMGVEIIVIDDGSTDESGNVCEEIKNEYSNVKIQVVHKHNEGLSVARNVGIDIASGEYVAFLDSDDMWQSNAVSVVIDNIEKHEAVDVFFFDADILDEIGGKNPDFYHRQGKVPSCVMEGREYFSEYYLDNLIVSACLCLYRREYLTSRNFRFTEGKLHEDISFSYKTLVNAKKVKYIPQALYLRRYREESITTNKVTDKNYDGIFTAYEECVQAFDELTEPEQRFRNKMAAFWNCATDYLESVCNEINGSYYDLMGLIDKFVRRILSSENEMSYSESKALLQLITKMDKHQSYLKAETEILLKNRIKSYLQDDVDLSLISVVNETRQRLIRQIPFDRESLKIGIYGAGKHSEGLIKDLGDSIASKIVFIKSGTCEKKEKFLEHDVYGTDNLPQDIDLIIISSFIYYNEIKRKLREIGFDKSKIIDFYETESLPLY